MDELRPGDRVRLLVPTLAGWQGTGRVTSVADGEVRFRKDGELGDGAYRLGFCRADEVELIAPRVDHKK
jgi:hypothetical protein